MRERIALIVGSQPETLLLDLETRRASGSFAALPGATFATYRVLEQRIAAEFEGWSIELKPPPLPVAPILTEADTVDQEAIATAAWAARRLDRALEVRGPQVRVDEVSRQLRSTGVRSVARPGGALRLSWTDATPDEELAR